jgi:MFS family permease
VAAGRFPGQFWLVFAATIVYLASSAIVFPFFGIYMTERLGISRTLAGVILGAASLAGLPMQLLGGTWADRRGRRGLMLFSLLASAVVLFGLTVVNTVWQAALLVLANGAFGWPLFLTASNAMVADLVEQDQTAEAYSIVRVAVNAGVVAGPAAAGFALAAGLSFAWLFAAAGVGCAALFLVLLARLAETRPEPSVPTVAGPLDAAEALAAASHHEAGASAAPAEVAGAAATPAPVAAPHTGYGVVLRDRAFLAFCLVSLLPLFCYGMIVSVYPVYVTQFLDVPISRWGVLLSLNAVLIVVIQYPLVRRLEKRDRLLLVALSSALLGIGIGGASLTGGGWTLWLLIVVFSLGEMIFVPLSTSLVSGMTTAAERGRYMGVWSLVWIGGQALSPLLAGWGMDAAGGRTTFFLVMLVGLAGTAAYPLVCRRRGATALR